MFKFVLNFLCVVQSSFMEPRKYKFKNSELTIIFGNILDSKADVIVSSDDTEISMGGGVSSAILCRGGETVRADAKKKLPARVGDVVVSSSGNLPQKYIFHCLTKRYGAFSARDEVREDNTDIEEYIIRNSIDKCFALLHAMDIRSIAFPCIGEGAAGIPLSKVASLMAETIAKNLSKTHKEYHIELYLYDRFDRRGELDYISVFEAFSAHSALVERNSIFDLQHLQSEESISVKEIVGVSVPDKNEMNHDVFISYSRKDTDTVAHIRALLEENGIAYWIDKTGIFSGQRFKEVIVDAIDTAKAVLFISSVNSNRSKNVIKEIGTADKLDKIVVPLRLDDAPYDKNIIYDVANVDHIEYGAVDYEQRLVKSLKGAIGKSK